MGQKKNKSGNMQNYDSRGRYAPMTLEEKIKSIVEKLDNQEDSTIKKIES